MAAQLSVRPGELIIVGARPSVGKTAFALAIARHVCIDLSLPVLLISLEQSEPELADRLVCAEAMVSSDALREGRISDEQVRALQQAINTLAPGKLWVDDGSATATMIAAVARSYRLRHGVALVLIDYLQLIEPDDRRRPRHEQLATISRTVKRLARDLAIPIVALAQLNRASEDRQRPRMSDLRESGALEADADIVLLLDRTADRPADVDVIVAKQRNGKTGETALRFVREYTRFQDNYYELPLPPSPPNGG